MTQKELAEKIKALEKEKLWIEYQIQNYTERLDRLKEYGLESEEQPTLKN